MTNLVRTIKNAFNERQKIRKTIRELSALSNRELADIGIGRAEIDFIARTNPSLSY